MMKEWLPMIHEEAKEQCTRLGQQTEQLLQWLSRYGADPSGGVTRLLYSESWLEAQQALAERMKQAGLTVSFDRSGNVYGRLEGLNPTAPAIVTGSHIDTVTQGGRYDGAYGIAAALLSLEYILEHHGRPERTIEIVSMCEEEGSRFPKAYWGSGSITGALVLQDVAGLRDADGIRFEDAMQAAGFGLPGQKDPVRSDIAAFIELHVEQGIVLEKEGLSVGIVDAIAGQRRFTFEVNGEANHAGTTPMLLRRDALAGAVDMMQWLRSSALQYGAPLVATVGRLELVPNTSNVIPGQVTFTVDVRHDQADVLDRFCTAMLEQFERIAAAQELGLQHSLWMDAAPAPMTSSLSSLTESICRQYDIPYRHMVSGAGHDAQMFQRVCPTAMIFVPSHRGISHSPLEYTSLEDLGTGVFVLSRLLYDLGYSTGSTDAMKGMIR